MKGKDSLSLEATWSRLEKFWLYETKTYFYLIGLNEAETRFRLLKINRTIERPDKIAQIVHEDPVFYSAGEMSDILDMIAEGNRASGGLTKVCTAFAIVGFVKFLNGFYLTLVTQRKDVGCIAGSTIYSIKATEMFAIKPHEEPDTNAFKMMWKKLNKKLSQTNLEIAENRYVGLFQFVDMTKDFFFSYTYDLTHSLQFNYLTSKNGNVSLPQEMFEWNHYQINDFRMALGGENAMFWTVPIIHGSYQQRRFNTFGRNLDLILLARRSRHYAGTRYLKRGLSVHGKVANDCEIEQIIQHDAATGLEFSSYLQMRGSIPTYWYQETSVTMPKPPILLNRVDPEYLATQEHFADLFRRYSSPIIVLDLVKQHEKRPRESIIGREFRQAISVLNESIVDEHKIRYLALDYSRITSISKGKFTKVKVSKSRGVGGLLTFKTNSAADKGSNRAMAAVGDEWAMMETSLARKNTNNANDSGKEERNNPRLPSVPSQNSLSGAQQKPHSSAVLTNFDDAKKGFTKNAMISSGADGIAIENIAEFNAVESRIDVLKELEDIANLTLHETGFFCSEVNFVDRVQPIISPSHVLFDSLESSELHAHTRTHARRSGHIEQRGVLRTNCVDCLDRTNGGQFAVAMRFLLLSLQALGLTNHAHNTHVDVSKDPVLLSLMEMYGEMGDKIALQYGGSEAHKKVLAGKSVKSSQKSKQSELLTSIKRYYSNAFTDMVKQDAMNLFLGCFIPSESAVPLWDLESDYNLHNSMLHPPMPRIHKVLYSELARDCSLLREMKLKTRLEVSMKRALLEATGAMTREREKDKERASPNKRKAIENAAISFSEPVKPSEILAAMSSAADKQREDEKQLQQRALPLSPSAASVVLSVSSPPHTSASVSNGYISVDWERLVRHYYIRHVAETAAQSTQTLSLSAIASRLKAKNALSSTIRAIARCERRKLIRIVAAQRVSSAAEMWWSEALTEYAATLKGEVNSVYLPTTRNLLTYEPALPSPSFSAPLSVSPSLSPQRDTQAYSHVQEVEDEHLPVEDQFTRTHRPDRLTEFDVLLSLDYLEPVHTVREDALWATQREEQDGEEEEEETERERARRQRVQERERERESERERAEKERERDRDDDEEEEVDGGGRADSNDVSSPPLNSLTSLLSFYPSLLPSATPAAEAASEAERKENDKEKEREPISPPPPPPLSVSPSMSVRSQVPFSGAPLTPPPSHNNGKDSSSFTPAADNNANNNNNGNINAKESLSATSAFKYVRDFGMKAARSLVSGFMKREESSAQPRETERKRGRLFSGEQDPKYDRITASIAHARHFIPRHSLSLYRQYVDTANDPFSMLFDQFDARKCAAVSREYEALVRDHIISVDDVQRMEALAEDAHISLFIKKGIYQGLPHHASAKLAYLFLFLCLVQLESDLSTFGATVDQKAQLSRQAAFAPVGEAPSLSDTHVHTHSHLSAAKTARERSASPPVLLQPTHNASPTQPTQPVVPSPRPQHAPPHASHTSHGPHTHNADAITQSMQSLRSSSMEMTSLLQDRISAHFARFSIAHGLEVELKKNVNNYIFQQYTYSKDLSVERLSRRVSSNTSERSIIDYCSLFDPATVSANWDEIHYIASANPNYESLRDLFSLQKHLSKEIERARERKRELLAEMEKRRERQREQDRKKNKEGVRERARKDLSVVVADEDKKSNGKEEEEREEDGNEEEEEKDERKDTLSPLREREREREHGKLFRPESVMLPADSLSLALSANAAAQSSSRSLSAQLGLSQIAGLSEDLRNMMDYTLDLYSSGPYPQYPYNQQGSFLTSDSVYANKQSQRASDQAEHVEESEEARKRRGYEDYLLGHTSSLEPTRATNEKHRGELMTINHDYVGFNPIAPDLFTRSTNPHLQLNEIGVVRFQETLQITNRRH